MSPICYQPELYIQNLNLLHFFEADCEAAAWGHCHREIVVECNVSLLYDICLRIILVVCIICITINCSLIYLARLKELERNVKRTILVICNTTAEPLSVLLSLTCNHYILTRFSKEIS